MKLPITAQKKTLEDILNEPLTEEEQMIVDECYKESVAELKNRNAAARIEELEEKLSEYNAFADALNHYSDE